MAKLVTCVTKLDRGDIHDRITHIGGSWGKITEQQAIAEIKVNPGIYEVSVNGKTVTVIVSSRNGREYLKTSADKELENNLLSLANC